MTIILCILLCINVYLFIKTNQERQELIATKSAVQSSIKELQNVQKDVHSKLELLDVIYNTAEKYNVPPEITLAVMKVESNFDTHAVNGHSRGLMQMDSRYHKGDLFNIKTNVECSFSLLSSLIEESNSLEEALGKYNRGVTGYKRYVNSTGETVTTYSKKVMSVLDTLNK